MTDEEIAVLLGQLDRVERVGLTDQSSRNMRRLCESVMEARRERDEAAARLRAGAETEVVRAVLAKLDAVTAERDEARDKAAQYERDWYDAKSEFGTAMAKMRRERDKAEQRGRAAERALVRAAVEQMMVDAVHEVSDLRVMMREVGKTGTTYADFTRSQGKIDTCERVLEMLDGRHVGAAGKGET